jgi:signal transduction histidine kinase
MKISLKYKFFLALIFSALIPILIIGFLGLYLLFYNFTRNSITNIETNLLTQKEVEINNFFEQHFDNLDIIIALEAQNIPYFQDINNYEKLYDLQKEKFILLQIIQQRQEIIEISFIDLNGNEKIKYYRSQDKIVNKETNLTNQSELNLFKKARNGENFISDVFDTLNGPMIITSNPIKSKDGIVVAILKTKLSLEPIRKIIKNSSLGQSGYVYLVDKNGYLVFKSNQEQSSLTKLDQILPITQNKLEKLLKYKNFNKEVYGLAKFLSKYGLFLIVEWPVSEANQPINRQILLIIFSIVVISLVTFLLSMFLAKIITNPIEILKTGAKKVSEGKFEKLADIKTGDEIEDLIKEFNFMVDGLIQLQKLKDEFVFIAAHELRAPVAAMKGYLSLLIDGTVGKIDETAKEFMIKVRNSNERLIQLVADLLQIARTEAGTIKIDVKPVDIREAINPIINEFKIEAEKRNITISYEELPQIPQILADLDRLKEILANLISNAIKYNLDNGKIFIYHQIDGNNLLTYVKDTGLGIPKDQQAKIFQKFFRVQSKATENIQGTGLGLFIVKQIIEKMNGKIWFESEEGKGTTFIFSLPIFYNNR